MSRFPVYDLNSALVVAERLQQRGGGTASTASLAEFLGYKSTNNGAFISRAAAARMFGLISGQGAAISVTDRALAILQPDYAATAERARLEAFDSVDLYRSVVDMYHGQQLPPDSGLLNTLETKFGIPKKHAPLALARLMSSAEQAGLFKIAGGRTKFIRPAISPVASTSTTTPAPTADRPARPNVKLIDGALEELPAPGDGWSQEGLSDWLALFEHVLRIVYKLPRPAESKS